LGTSFIYSISFLLVIKLASEIIAELESRIADRETEIAELETRNANLGNPRGRCWLVN